MSEPVNILYMIDSLDHGGTERQLVELIRNIDRSRFRPHLCTLKASNRLYDELDVPKILLDFVSFHHPSIFGNLLRLSGFVRKNRIQIIQTFFQDPFLLAAMVKPFHRVKLVGSFRDLGFWRTPAETRKMHLAYPFFSGFIANSQAVKDHFVKTDGLKPDRIEVIYNGFDFDGIPDDQPCKKADDPPVVGIVANLCRPVKRVHDFIHAAALVRKEAPRTRFVVVGDGYLRKELETLADSLGLGCSIRFTGRINNPLDVIRMFDIGVITSETEGFCNAIVEYMACGVTVVATNAGGNPELVEEGENGFLIPVGHAEILSERIVALLADKAFRSRIGEHNREKIRRDFSWPAALELQSRCYERLVAI
jgi:glycosyltransferase involved in cell wall biosynthesis